MMTVLEIAEMLTTAGAELAQAAAVKAELAEARKRIEALEVTVAAQLKEIDALRNAQAPTRGLFEVVAGFDSQRALWHGRLRETITAQRGSILSAAANATPEIVGFVVKDYVLALTWALGGVGDPVLLDEIVCVLDALRSRVVFEVTLAKDMAFVGSLYALAAYVLHVNKHADAAYWRGRALDFCKDGIVGDDLMHPYAASAETAAYLWLVTGESRWKDDYDERRAELERSISIDLNGRAAWFHRPKFAEDKPLGRDVPASTYARYVVQSLCMLERLRLPGMLPMEAIRKTVLFLTSPPNSLYYWLDGQTRADSRNILQTYDTAKLATSNWGMVNEATVSARLAAVWARNHIAVPAALVGAVGT